MKSVNNFLKADQEEVREVAALKDAEIYAALDHDSEFTVQNGNLMDGLPAQDISGKPLRVAFDITAKTTPQVCLLIKGNKEKPEKVKIKYEGTEQEFIVDWNQWGWAPVALVKTFDQPGKVEFEIESENPGSGLMISKVFLRSMKLGYTD
jgi:hypothetical protein